MEELLDCKPYYKNWLKCHDTNPDCCSPSKCSFQFRKWKKCTVENNERRARNLKTGIKMAGTFNGPSRR